MKKSYSLTCILALVMSSNAFADVETNPMPVLVCRARQCAEASYSMTKGFLFNKVAQMMERNIGKKVLICEADPVSHACLTEGIHIPAETKLSKTQVTIEDAVLTDSKMVMGSTAVDIVFDYKVKANATYPKCQLNISRLNVDYVDKVEMMGNDFSCNVTETGSTSMNMTYNIDYFDFDYGFIGAYYTIGIGEAVKGDKSGYMLMRFTDEAPQTATTEVKTKTVSTTETKTTVGANEPDILKETAPQIEVVTTEVVKEKAPTVVKTTTIEKTIITPDGSKKDVIPPETRTVVEELK